MDPQDAALLARWLRGPGARPTDADVERWARLAREGQIPRRTMTVDELAVLHYRVVRGHDRPIEERREEARRIAKLAPTIDRRPHG